VGQRELVERFVKEVVERHGYKLAIDPNEMRAAIDAFQAEVNTETLFEKRVKIVTPELHRGSFYFVEGVSRPLIPKQEYELLTANPKQVTFYYDSSDDWQRRHHTENYKASKSNKDNHIIVNGTEQKVRGTVEHEKTTTTKAPNDRLKTAWNNHVSTLLSALDELKGQIHTYRSNDLAQLRANAFVPAELASHVETHITDTLKTIEKNELEVKRIQHYYENVKSESKTKKV
jgi:tryptophanyl-tRNA synthetase